MSASWRLTLPCTKAEVDAFQRDVDSFLDLDDPPVLVTREPDPARPDDWRLDAYFEGEPAPALIDRVRALVPSAAGEAALPEPVAEADWVTISQSGFEPIRAGRFFVYTSAYADRVPQGCHAFRIEAGQAFGTGHHATTTGCLRMLDRLHRRRARFGNVVDVGTGTGLLAFAAHALWPTAHVAASDIDPVSIVVTAENAAANRVRTGRGPGSVELMVAPGLAHRRLVERAPYDLIVANILAHPLIQMAPSLCEALAPGGTVILAGLLRTQADAVARAYRREGLLLVDRVQEGDWPTLRLEAR